jgi:hypothetical protein
MRSLLLSLCCLALLAEEDAKPDFNVVDGLADRILAKARSERAAGRLPPPEVYPTTDLNFEPPWLQSIPWKQLPWDQLERSEAIKVLDLLYKHGENQWYTNLRAHRLDRSIQEQLDLVDFKDGDVRKRMPTMFVQRWTQAMAPTIAETARQRSAALHQAMADIKRLLDQATSKP